MSIHDSPGPTGNSRYLRRGTGNGRLWLTAILSVVIATAISGDPELPVVDVTSSSATTKDRSSLEEELSTFQQNGIANKVETSANVFVESLQTASKLDSSYYVTDTKQQTDFFWYRESGIRINVGLQAIDLIPVYDDVLQRDGGDNEFIIGNPSSSEESARFQNTISHHCRTPLPDHYSLTMEISRDRTTRASMEVCTDSTFGQGRCPEGVGVDDRFLRRTLNEPCRLLESYPEPLVPAANSVVCTESGLDLLRLFNVSAGHERLVTVHSRTCRTAQYRCRRCVEKAHCLGLEDPFERRCCEIDCHLETDCKMALSSECQSAFVECAMGDTYRYTLQPIFVDLGSRFRCHLTRRRPATLFQLWFYVAVPGFDFETPKVNFSAFPSTTSTTASSHSSANRSFHFEFLTVEANTGFATRDRLILTGTESGAFAIHPEEDTTAATTGSDGFGSGSSAEGSEGWTARQEISENIRVLLTKFARPFGYSTSSWSAGGDRCVKNISEFVPYGSREPEVLDDVSVVKRKLGGAFEYLLKSKTKPPSLRLLIPENASMLRWWFRDQDVSLAPGVPFRARLSRSPDGGHSLVHISGTLSRCPGYLSVVVTDRMSGEELLNYDVLVSCPSPDFHVTFPIPDPGSDDPSAAAAPGRTVYDLRIDDTKRIHGVLLVGIHPPPDKSSSSGPSCSVAAAGVRLVVDSEPEGRASVGSLPLAAAILGFGVVCSIFASVVCSVVFLAGKRRSNGKSDGRDTSRVIYLTKSARRCGSSSSSSCSICHCRIFIGVWFVTRIAYNVLFTCSAFCVLLTVTFERSFEETTSFLRRNITKNNHLVSESLKHPEILPDLSCNHAADYAFGVFPKDDSILHDDPMSRSAAAEAWNRSFTKYLDEARTYLADVRSKLRVALTRASRRRSRLARSAFTNDWLLYPFSLFSVNISAPMERHSSDRQLKWRTNRGPVKLDTWEMDFSLFLGMEEISLTEQLDQEIMNRCKEFASLRFLEFVFITSLNNSCDRVTEDSALTGSLDHADSTRFYGSVESFHDWIRSQNGRSAARTATAASPPPPPALKNANWVLLENSSTETAKGRKIHRLRSLLDNSGLEEEMAWKRIMVILIALDCFVLFRRMFCLHEKLESFRSCLRKHHPPPSSLPPPPPLPLPSKVRGNFEEGHTNPNTATDPMAGSAPSKAGPGDLLDEEGGSVPLDNGPASSQRPPNSLFEENLRIESRNIACSNSNLDDFLRTFWNGTVDATVIPELVAVAVVTTLVLTGVNVLSRKMGTLEIDEDNWTDIVRTWTTWTNRREEGNQKLESEGKIISELVYLDATIGHLCTERKRFASVSNQKLQVSALCHLGKADSDVNTTSDESWEKKLSMTSQLLAASQQMSYIESIRLFPDVSDYRRVFDCYDSLVDAVLLSSRLTLTLIAVLACLRCLSWTTEMATSCLVPSSSGEDSTGRRRWKASKNWTQRKSEVWIHRIDDDDGTRIQNSRCSCCSADDDHNSGRIHLDDHRPFHLNRPCVLLRQLPAPFSRCHASRFWPQTPPALAPSEEGDACCPPPLGQLRHHSLASGNCHSLGRFVHPRASDELLRRTSSVGCLAQSAHTNARPPVSVAAVTSSYGNCKRISLNFYPCADEWDEAATGADRRTRRRQTGVRNFLSSFSETIV